MRLPSVTYSVTLVLVPTYGFQPHVLLLSALQCVLDFPTAEDPHTHHPGSHLRTCARAVYLSAVGQPLIIV